MLEELVQEEHGEVGTKKHSAEQIYLRDIAAGRCAVPQRAASADEQPVCEK
jgi:hypothetical protein